MIATIHNCYRNLTRLLAKTKPGGDHLILPADPVALKTSNSGIFCLPQQALALSDEQACQLVSSINDQLLHSMNGVELSVGSCPKQWWLQVPVNTKVKTVALAKVEGREISRFMPSGPDGASYRALMTEIQMLLHNHQVNQKRRAANELTVDSIWLGRKAKWWWL